MPAKPDPKRDEPVKIPLDPEEALRAFLAVDPGPRPPDDDAEAPASGEGEQEPQQ